jgi:hypothetical protein
MHVALRHAQLALASGLLNRTGWCASHRQVRAEQVPQHMDPVRHITPPRCTLHAILHLLPRQRMAVLLAPHVGAPQNGDDRGRKSDRERDTRQSSAFRRYHLAVPVGSLDADLRSTSRYRNQIHADNHSLCGNPAWLLTVRPRVAIDESRREYP